MWRRIIAVFIVTGVLVASFDSTASAHVLTENNGTSAVLHIPPDDNPVAKHPTTLGLSFSSDTGNFKIQNCDCRATVQLDGKTIQSTTLRQVNPNSNTDADATINFPDINVYDVTITGKARDGGFQPFALHYVERVASSAGASSQTERRSTGTVFIIGVSSFLVLGMIGYAYIEPKRH